MSGRLWAQQRIVRYYLHRRRLCPVDEAGTPTDRVLTSRKRVGLDLPAVIGELNLFLCGWGNYFRTGNAADKFVQLDRHVVGRLKRLLINKRGRNLRAGQAARWTRAWFHD